MLENQPQEKNIVEGEKKPNHHNNPLSMKNTHPKQS